MILYKNNTFELDTENTSYIFRIMENGYAEHLFYGGKITMCDDAVLSLSEKQTFLPGNTNAYSEDFKNMTAEDLCLEMSAYGKGDVREASVCVVNPDGSRTGDFVFESYEINRGKKEFDTLPGSYGNDDEVDTLKITFKDKVYDIYVDLFYFVYEKSDVITRRTVVRNGCNENIRLLRIMSSQIDFLPDEYYMTTFNGAWAREMKKNTVMPVSGRYVNSSFTGTSSNKANPFVMMGKADTTEDYGECYGFNLIYSGNHYSSAEVNSFGKVRFVSGINPEGFEFLLGKGEEFESPEAVMTFSSCGYNGMSRNMHYFVRNHIVRGYWKNKVRPILLNSWEAAYFDINENRLLRLAGEGAKAGIELFVMDDGWFGKRNDDTSSLGDWEVNKKKFPGGLKRMAEKINALGMKFGIWVEPEMVNTDSELYKNHKDWVIEIDNREHSEGRHQRILDLTQREVQDYIIDSMTNVFSSANIEYVKWDMNRTFTDVYSKKLPPERQGEVFHRYYIGLYRCLKILTERFPEILFEGCSAGGNRFDLGMLCYFPQIWASDNTDALCRCEMQYNYSYGYPQSVMTSHISGCPNHQTLRTTPLRTRFNVASMGVLGYECNLCDMKKEDFNEIREQIKIYKEWRETLQYGKIYRTGHSGRNNYDGVLAQTSSNVMTLTYVSEDGNDAVGLIVQKLAVANAPYMSYKAKGLEESRKYHFYNEKIKYNIKEFGDLINTVAPIHIRQDSFIHNAIAGFVKMDGETEDYILSGSILCKAGVKLKQGFAASGYNDEIRHFPDFASRMYFMKAVN